MALFGKQKHEPLSLDAADAGDHGQPGVEIEREGVLPRLDHEPFHAHVKGSAPQRET